MMTSPVLETPVLETENKAEMGIKLVALVGVGWFLERGLYLVRGNIFSQNSGPGKRHINSF